MAIQLGENPWLLIGLTCFEFLFIIIPALISSKLEKKSFKDVINEMGFQKNDDIFIKTISGICFGIVLFFFGNYIIIFFQEIIIRNIFGNEFVEAGEAGAISTSPLQPNNIQLMILIIIQLIIIGPCEESFFRGFLIKKLKTKLKLAYSIIISSIIFTLYHVPPFLVPLTTILTFFGYYFTFGLILSLIYVYFDFSLIPCSIAHSIFNILILLL
ncbi:MAG: type II CAAX prenyl endopeptidase Rce1 family protein [Promethearchaeota archaeon]